MTYSLSQVLGFAIVCVAMMGTESADAIDAPAAPPQEINPSGAHDVWHDLTEDDKNALLAFLLRYNMANVVRPGVLALIAAHDSQTAVDLVVKTYNVQRRTAELFVYFEARTNDLDTTGILH